METIKLIFQNHHAIIQLNRPKANAINTLMVQELCEAFASLAEADYVHGVIITGQGDFFCAGLDVVEMVEYNEDQVEEFWKLFGRLIHDMALFSKPLVAAINGHSPAGGCVLSICCDHRIMAEGNFRIGLNEIPVGIAVPKPIVELAAFTVGRRKAARMFLDGKLMPGKEARDFGLVDDICSQAEVLKWAEVKLTTWLEFSQPAWRKTKKTLRAGLVEVLNMDVSQAYADTIHSWWSSECRATMGKMAESLTARS